jgi:hypothetical protein
MVGQCNKMDNKDMAWEGVDWIHMAEDRDRGQALGNTVGGKCIEC